MNAAIVWTIVSMVVGAAVMVRVAYFSKPKRQLKYSVDSKRLFSPEALVRGVRFMMGDTRVSVPYIVTIKVWPSGRDDIGTSDFDSAKRIEFSVNTKMLDGTLEQRAGTHAMSRLDDQTLTIMPQLIKRNSLGFEVSVITNGPPNVKVIDTLVNSEIKPAKNSGEAFAPSQATSLISMIAGGSGLLAIFIVGLAGGAKSENVGAFETDISFSFMALGVVLAAVVTGLTLDLWKAGKARRDSIT